MSTDTDGGRYGESYDDGAFLDALAAEGGAAASSDVAEHVGCSRRTATRRLTELARDGRIDRREVGRAVLWFEADA